MFHLLVLQTFVALVIFCSCCCGLFVSYNTFGLVYDKTLYSLFFQFLFYFVFIFLFFFFSFFFFFFFVFFVFCLFVCLFVFFLFAFCFFVYFFFFVFVLLFFPFILTLELSSLIHTSLKLKKKYWLSIVVEVLVSPNRKTFAVNFDKILICLTDWKQKTAFIFNNLIDKDFMV